MWEPQALNFLDQQLADDMQRIWKELKHKKEGETWYCDNCAYNNSNHMLIGIGTVTGELERGQISHMERADDTGITKISNNRTPYINSGNSKPYHIWTRHQQNTGGMATRQGRHLQMAT